MNPVYKVHRRTPYSGNLSWVKTFANCWKSDFRNENFRVLWEMGNDMPTDNDALVLNEDFCGLKLSRIVAKFVKVFTHQGFPLYNIVLSAPVNSECSTASEPGLQPLLLNCGSWWLL